MTKPLAKASHSRKNEHELMQRIAAGDKDAFQEFDHQYRKLILYNVNKVLNKPDDCEDIANEVLLKIWKCADSYHPAKGSLVSWISTMSRNRAIDHVRSLNRRQRLNTDFRDKLERERTKTYESGWDQILREDTRKLLVDEMEKLPEDQQEILELVYFKGLTQRQIAEHLGYSLGMVKSRIQRGLATLRGSLNRKHLLAA